uniref:helix-turn-helix domain-containing protein n=1 Tax=Rhizobium sp. F40D2 TaxID=3453141 RepID=UPI003F21D7B3
MPSMTACAAFYVADGNDHARDRPSRRSAAFERRPDDDRSRSHHDRRGAAGETGRQSARSAAGAHQGFHRREYRPAGSDRGHDRAAHGLLGALRLSRLRGRTADTVRLYLGFAPAAAAAKLREAGGHSGEISEIAFALGFSSSAHFSRAFRARYAVSPSQWRKAALS